MENVVLAPGFIETCKSTRDNLKNHLDWEDWKASDFFQLDAMDKDNMFGPPCRILYGSIVMIQVWTYVIRQSEKRKSRNTWYVSPLTGKGVQYSKNYSACASQHVFKLFLPCIHLWDI